MDGRAAIIKEIFIKAPPKAVFEILTNPLKIVRWMGPQAKLGDRSHRLWRLNLNGRATVRGRCLKLRRDRKVMFTWGCAKIGHGIAVIDSVVVIILKSQGEGTWVQLIHHKLHRTLVKYGSRAAGLQLLSRNKEQTGRVAGIRVTTNRSRKK